MVRMYDGEVTFKGGTITNTKATVRIAHDARSHTGTGCRMLRGLRRAMCGARCVGMWDSMGPFEVYWMPHVAARNARCIECGL